MTTDEAKQILAGKTLLIDTNQFSSVGDCCLLLLAEIFPLLDLDSVCFTLPCLVDVPFHVLRGILLHDDDDSQEEEQLVNFEKYNTVSISQRNTRYTNQCESQFPLCILPASRLSTTTKKRVFFFFISSVNNDEGRPDSHLHRSLFVVLLRDADKKRKT